MLLGGDPGHYFLGLLLNVMEERFQKRLTISKKHYLSKEGRLALIKSTPFNLYFMSSFVNSRKVSLGLEKIQRDFLSVLEGSPFSTLSLSTNGEKFTIERDSFRNW